MRLRMPVNDCRGDPILSKPYTSLSAIHIASPCLRSCHCRTLFDSTRPVISRGRGVSLTYRLSSNTFHRRRIPTNNRPSALRRRPANTETSSSTVLNSERLRDTASLIFPTSLAFDHDNNNLASCPSASTVWVRKGRCFRRIATHRLWSPNVDLFKEAMA